MKSAMQQVPFHHPSTDQSPDPKPQPMDSHDARLVANCERLAFDVGAPELAMEEKRRAALAEVHDAASFAEHGFGAVQMRLPHRPKGVRVQDQRNHCDGGIDRRRHGEGQQPEHRQSENRQQED